MQEESNNEIHVTPSLSSGECQLFPASQGSEPRLAFEIYTLVIFISSYILSYSVMTVTISTLLKVKKRKKIHQ